MKQFRISSAIKNLSGERGLLLAILALAYRDLKYGKPELQKDAQRYFHSATFREHLELLELPSDFTPQA